LWGGIKTRNDKWIQSAYHKYALGRQTLEDLSLDISICSKTFKDYFDNYCFITGEIHIPKNPVNLIIDATFFTRSDGVLVARANSKNLIWKEIETEKVEYYEELILTLQFAGVLFSAFVIDGKRGVLHMLIKKFPNIPIQYCQFHQLQIITHYLSRKPKLETGKELRRLNLALTKTDRETFIKKLKQWHEEWEDFLIEKTINPITKRTHYTHKRLRSAHRSLKTNLPYLFTYLDYPELNIPNTTNSCDRSFAHWKGRLGVHKGLSKERRSKMMNYLLKNS